MGSADPSTGNLPGSERDATSSAIGDRCRVGAVIVTSVVAALVGPPNHDDGWIIHRGRLLIEAGLHQNIDPFVRGSVTVLGRPWELLIGFLAGLGSVAGTRLASVGALVAGWIGIAHILRRMSVPERGRYLSVLIFLIGVPPMASSVRPEPIVAALLVSVLLIAHRVHLHRRTGGALLWVLSALSLSIHQTGWAVVSASIAIALMSLRGLEAARRNRSFVATGLVGLVIGLGILLAWVPLTLFISSSANHTEYLVLAGAVPEAPPVVGVFEESNRYLTLLSGFTFYSGRLPHLVLTITAAISILGLIRLGALRLEDPVAGLVIPIVAAVAGLSFTNSKWIVHLLVLAPVAAISLPLLMVRWDRSREGGRLEAPIAVALIVVVLHSLGQQGIAGMQVPLAALPWDVPAPDTHAAPAILVLSGLSVVAIHAATRRLPSGLRVATAVCLSILVMSAVARAIGLSGLLGDTDALILVPMLEGSLLPLAVALTLALVAVTRSYGLVPSRHRMLGVIAVGLGLALATVLVASEAVGLAPMSILGTIDESLRPWIDLVILGLTIELSLIVSGLQRPSPTTDRIRGGGLMAILGIIAGLQLTAMSWGTVESIRSGEPNRSFGAAHLESLARDGSTCDLVERLLGRDPEASDSPVIGRHVLAPAIEGLAPCAPLAPPTAGVMRPVTQATIRRGDDLYLLETAVGQQSEECVPLPSIKPAWVDSAYVSDICFLRFPGSGFLLEPFRSVTLVGLPGDIGGDR